MSSGAWSPNSQLIAFSKGSFEGQRYLEVIDVEGSNLTKRWLGSSGQIGAEVDWSPSGRHIAFSRFQTGRQDIWTHGIYSGVKKNLTRSDAYEIRPQWVTCPST